MQRVPVSCECNAELLRDHRQVVCGRGQFDEVEVKLRSAGARVSHRHRVRTGGKLAGGITEKNIFSGDEQIDGLRRLSVHGHRDLRSITRVAQTYVESVRYRRGVRAPHGRAGSRSVVNDPA